uniref:Uncharacterized protein LOC104213416 n=1 Tax=Nicotiana sylvestris TaxID=4096 RepID=A0A1U7VFV7_NICSY|nr:PREDICTED: uncharacterized protein LOC104213416 [Nicotiana sylvestris]
MVPVMPDDEQRPLKRFNRLAPPPFSGAQGEDAQGFLDKCRRMLRTAGILETSGVSFTTFQFSELARYAPWMVPTDRERIRRFMDGLIYPIRILMARERILSHTFEDAVDIARDIKADHRQEREEREAKRPRGSGRGHQGFQQGQSSLGALPVQSSSHAPSVQGSLAPSASASHFGARGSHQFPYPASGSCYECGEFGHMMRHCPRLRGS